MANAAKPDGKSRSQRVSFTRSAADRIARAVRAVESSPSPASGLSFSRVAAPSPGNTIRVATFTGGWSFDGLKNVALVNGTVTSNTVLARNLTYTIASGSTNERKCLVAKANGEWVLVSAELVRKRVLVDAELTSDLTFEGADIGVLSFDSGQDVTIAVEGCDESPASPEALSFFL